MTIDIATLAAAARAALENVATCTERALDAAMDALEAAKGALAAEPATGPGDVALKATMVLAGEWARNGFIDAPGEADHALLLSVLRYHAA